MSRAAIRSAPDRDYCRPLLCVALAFAATSAALELASVRATLMPFAILTAHWTALCLDWLGTPVARSAIELRHAGGFACDLDAACTALVPLVLLSAAIGTSRLPYGRKVWGLLGGIVLMLLLNQIRLTSLVWYGVHAPEWLDPLHDWGWPALLAGGGVLYWRRLHGGSSHERAA